MAFAACFSRAARILLAPLTSRTGCYKCEAPVTACIGCCHAVHIIAVCFSCSANHFHCVFFAMHQPPLKHLHPYSTTCTVHCATRIALGSAAAAKVHVYRQLLIRSYGSVVHGPVTRDRTCPLRASASTVPHRGHRPERMQCKMQHRSKERFLGRAAWSRAPYIPALRAHADCIIASYICHIEAAQIISAQLEYNLCATSVASSMTGSIYMH